MLQESISDIESGNKKGTTGSESTNVKDSSVGCAKIFLVIFITLFSFPIIFCDLYFANNDNTCVNQKFEKFNVNMYQYLMVSGIYGSSTLFIINCCVALCDFSKFNDEMTLLFSILEFISKLFTTSWTIVGAVIFWHFMDNGSCSNKVYNYLFASLIIKLVCILLTSNSTSQSKK
jgi:hypothetical protein